MRRSIKCLTGAILAIITGAAMADVSPYVTFNIGHGWMRDARLKTVEYDAVNNTITGRAEDDQDGVWRAAIGNNFTEVLGAELGYSRFNEIRRNRVDATGTAVGRLKSDVHTIDLVGVMNCKITDNWSGLAKLGVGYSENTRRFSSLTPTVAANRIGNKEGWGIALGAGVEYDFNPTISARIEANGVTGTAATAQVSVGLVGHFV